jgi:hypothetical protein
MNEWQQKWNKSGFITGLDYKDGLALARLFEELFIIEKELQNPVASLSPQLYDNMDKFSMIYPVLRKIYTIIKEESSAVNIDVRFVATEYLRIIDHTERLFKVLYSEINTPVMVTDLEAEATIFCAKHIAGLMINQLNPIVIKQWQR